MLLVNVLQINHERKRMGYRNGNNDVDETIQAGERKLCKSCTCNQNFKHSSFSTSKVFPLVLEDTFIYLFGEDDDDDKDDKESDHRRRRNNIITYNIIDVLNIKIKPKDEPPFVGQTNVFLMTFENLNLSTSAGNSGCITSWYFQAVDPTDPLEFLKIVSQRMSNINDPPNVKRYVPRPPSMGGNLSKAIRNSVNMGSNSIKSQVTGNTSVEKEILNRVYDNNCDETVNDVSEGDIDKTEIMNAMSVNMNNNPIPMETKQLFYTPTPPPLGIAGTLETPPPKRASAMTVKFDGGVRNVEMASGKRRVKRIEKGSRGRVEDIDYDESYENEDDNQDDRKFDTGSTPVVTMLPTATESLRKGEIQPKRQVPGDKQRMFAPPSPRGLTVGRDVENDVDANYRSNAFAHREVPKDKTPVSTANAAQTQGQNIKTSSSLGAIAGKLAAPFSSLMSKEVTRDNNQRVMKDEKEEEDNNDRPPIDPSIL